MMCNICHNTLTKKTEGGTLILSCKTCIRSIPPSDADTLIAEGVVGIDRKEDIDQLCKNAAFDRTGKIVKVKCKKCNRPYMHFVTIITDTRLVCKCGYMVYGPDIESID